MRRSEIIGIFIAFFLFLVAVFILSIKNIINIDRVFELLILFALVVVTAIYAKHTLNIAQATREQAKAIKEQADASVRMAEEMRQQRWPIVIQKSVHEKDIWEGSTKDYFSHFEISNVGNTPAIEVESSLMDNEGNRPHSIRQTYLRNDDPPIKFRPANIVNLEETKTYYLVSEYQNIFSYGPQKPLYQTRLPFKISKSSEEGKIYMIAGELEFKEATEKERIDAFSRRSKPK